MQIVSADRFMVELPYGGDRLRGGVAGECKPSLRLTAIDLNVTVRCPQALRVAFSQAVEPFRAQLRLLDTPEFKHAFDTFAEANGNQSPPPSSLPYSFRLFEQRDRDGVAPSVHRSPSEHEIGSPRTLKHA